MKTIPQVLPYWKQYTNFNDLASLTHVLWDSESTPTFVEQLRSVCWKIYLVFHTPLDTTLCLPILRDSRSAYSSLRSHFLKAIDDPSSLNESTADPLCDDEQSLWDSFRADEAAREEIFRDVDRCMPDNDYFRDPRVQRLLLDILFVWCKLNPDVGYRQGMHEVLAPLIWVLDADCVEAANASNHDVQIAEVLDCRYLEHDAFTLFSRIMESAKVFYEPTSAVNESGEAPIITRSRHIMRHVLSAVDPELATHLVKIEVLPQIFLMRWIRLLFGREFPLQQVLDMWDLLFSSDIGLNLVDFTCVAMLLRIRWELLDADTNSALALLLRYSTGVESPPPRSLVVDADMLRKSTSTATGTRLIMKYTGKKPTVLLTDSGTSTPRRLRSPNRVNSSSRNQMPPASLESLFQDAARGVLSRGERWGFNQAVRDVVGEVRKGVVRGMQSSATSPSRPSSPGVRQAHGRGSGSETQTSGAIAANVLRKMNKLEDRNKKLAQMLDTAVKELWKCRDDISDSSDQKQNVKIDRPEMADRLGKAATDIQFVQAHLRDTTLALPEQGVGTEPPSSPNAPPDSISFKTVSPAHLPSSGPEHLVVKDTTSDSASATLLDAGTGQTMATGKLDVPHPSPRPSSVPSVPIQTEIPRFPISASYRSSSNTTSPKPAFTDPLISKPRLTSSSFSWMLADTDSGDAFSRAVPFAPNEKRSQARGGKAAFLFGEEDAEQSAEPTSRRTSPSRKAVRKGSVVPVQGENIDLAEVKAVELDTPITLEPEDHLQTLG